MNSMKRLLCLGFLLFLLAVVIVYGSKKTIYFLFGGIKM